MNRKLLWVGVGLALSIGAVQAQVGNREGASVLRSVDVERQGVLQRVEVERYRVWISGTAYQFTQATQAYIGGTRVYDLAQLVPGARVQYADDGKGRLTAMQVSLPPEGQGGMR